MINTSVFNSNNIVIIFRDFVSILKYAGFTIKTEKKNERGVFQYGYCENG